MGLTYGAKEMLFVGKPEREERQCTFARQRQVHPRDLKAEPPLGGFGVGARNFQLLGGVSQQYPEDPVHRSEGRWKRPKGSPLRGGFALTEPGGSPRGGFERRSTAFSISEQFGNLQNASFRTLSVE